ncbi:MAG: VCBS repeat-containing protein, partial [Acidobacteriota bacterium]|nr:VCBS repeat-containing protein [Acidobacteriota bacterium]
MSLTRRQLGRIAAGGLAAIGAPRLRGSEAPPLFAEVPPATSGITWVHDNAMSPDRQLPETMGPGVAFLDYDNDGWMDIFLVNSGESDFFHPKTPLKN